MRYIYRKPPDGIDPLVVKIWSNCRGTTGGFSSSCNPSVVLDFCDNLYGFSQRKKIEILETVQEMDSGFQIGIETRDPEEPPQGSSKAGEKAPDPLPLEEFLDCIQLCDDAVDTISDVVIGTLNQFHFMNGRTLETFIKDIGLSPMDLIDKESISDICFHTLGRPIHATPDYFSSALLPDTASEMLRKISRPHGNRKNKIRQ